MAFSYPEHGIFLTASFESKARRIFGVPPTHYVSNEELKYYYDILKDAQDDDEARTSRALLCSTNIECACFACTQRDSTLDVSTVSSTGNVADDEGDDTLDGPGAATSTPVTADNLHRQPSYDTSSYNDSNNQFWNCSKSDCDICSASESGSGTLSCSQSNCSICSADTSVWDSDPADPADSAPGNSETESACEPSVIVISDTDSVPDVVNISDDVDKTVVSSPPLRTLDQLWNSTFRSEEDTSIQWDSPKPAKKRLRRGLGFSDPFQGHPDIARKPIKPTRVVPVNLSPILNHTETRHAKPNVWFKEVKADVYHQW